MGDTSKHLTYFKVENFKRFESFEMNDLGQFNLIVGDNNVGKTSVLALLFDEDRFQFKNNLIQALDFRRLKSSYFYKDLELYANRDNSLDSNEFSLLFRYRKQDSKEESLIEVKIEKRTGSISIIVDQQTDRSDINLLDKFQINPYLYFPFVPFYIGHDIDLTNFYSNKIQKNRNAREGFVKTLSVIIPDIEGIELSNPYPEEPPHLIVYQKRMKGSLPLALFGDGALKLFRLIVEIITHRGKRLMIDEVDTGIHYSRFPQFWKTLLLAAIENGVQLFMTTHSEECIKYFVEAFNDPELKNFKSLARNISLIELPDKSVKAYTYNYEQLEANVHVGNEIRGGAR